MHLRIEVGADSTVVEMGCCRGEGRLSLGADFLPSLTGAGVICQKHLWHSSRPAPSF